MPGGLAAGRASGFVAPRFGFPSPAIRVPTRDLRFAQRSQISGEYAPSSRLAIHTAALDLLGTEAELLHAGAPGEWLDGFLFSLAGPIYAGTNEIQRNVVAERLLGLPR